MAAMDSWKVRFGARVVEGDGRCSQVPGLIAAAQAHLEAELLAGNAAEARDRIQQAEERLRNASADIDFAYSVMAAAGEIALRGGSLIPTQPLPSFHRLRERDLARWNAIGKLRAAEKPAKEALDSVELCRGHLMAAGLLLDHPGLPGVDGLIDAERRSCTEALETAWEKANDCTTLTGGARLDVAGAN